MASRLYCPPIFCTEQNFWKVSAERQPTVERIVSKRTSFSLALKAEATLVLCAENFVESFQIFEVQIWFPGAVCVKFIIDPCCKQFYVKPRIFW